MTLSTTTSRVSYPGTGSTGPFAFPFKIFTASDLLVTKRSAVGVETPLIYINDYSVNGAGNANGAVTLVVALAVGETLSIRRSMHVTQDSSIRNQGTYFPLTIEDELDRLVMIDQSQQDQIDRSLKLSETLDPMAYTLALPAPAVGKVVTGTGSGFTMTQLDSSAVSLPGSGRTVATLSAYLANNAVYNVMDFGAVADGVTDDTAAFQRAHDAIGAAGGLIYVPGNRRYLLNKMNMGAQFTISKSKVALAGDGWSTVLVHSTTGAADSSWNGVVLVRAITGNISDIRILNLAIEGPTTNSGAANPAYAPNEVAGIAVGGSAEGNAYDTSNVEIAGCSISKMDGSGIAILGSAGQNFNGVKGIRIHHNRIANIRDRGINPLGANVFDFKVDGNVITQCDGLGIDSGATGVSITDNDISFVSQGISVTGNNLAGLSDTHQTLVSGNRITDIGTTGVPNGVGVLLNAEGGTDTQNVTVSDNQIRRVGGAGILGPGSTNYRNVSILGNTIQDVGKAAAAAYSGIALGGASLTNIAIEGNNCTTTAAGYSMNYGIDVNLAGAAPVIQNNRIFGAVTAPIRSATTAVVACNVENGVTVLGHSGPRLVLANGANQNVVLPSGADFFQVTGPTGAFSIGGIAGGIDGRRITLLNVSNFAMSLLHGSGGSAAANQLRTQTGATITVTSNQCGMISLRYVGAGLNLWVVESHL